jgi:hypothetical protein
VGRRPRAPPCLPAPPRPGLQPVDAKQQRERHDEHHGRNRRRAGVVVLLELRHDEERRDLRFERQVAGYEDYGPVLTKRAGEGEREARYDSRQQRRQQHPSERLPVRRAERPRRLLDLRFEILEQGMHGADDERQADEREGHDHAERRERHLNARWREIAADPAVLRVHGRERDAGDRRRHRKRQIDQRIYNTPAGERVPDQYPGDDQPEQGVDGRCHRGCAERQLVRRERAGRPDRVPELRPRERAGLDEHPTERNQHEQPEVEEREPQRRAESRQNRRVRPQNPCGVRLPPSRKASADRRSFSGGG